ncbi:MAG: transcriptional regulator [Candidatus Omnitrophota bacterium]|jgi:ATP-dependent DNA helicase RecG|nr:MAG: transcriptional regulator [Candidatus Omnitrophota bacterium]
MLTIQELQALMTDLESDRVERTSSTKDTDKFAEAICAFANDLPNHKQPGYLLIGVDDHGNPTGLNATDQLLQNLGALRSDGNIQPLPVLTVDKCPIPGKKGDVAYVIVEPSDMPPVRYKGRIWIRVGPRRAVASEQEERILIERRTALAKSFDSRPCSGGSLNDLSVNLFTINYLPNAVSREIIEENKRELTDQLASLRFYDHSKGCPTFAGILLFGIDPLSWIPGAYIQFVRFSGTEITDEIQNEHKFSGDLLTVLRELDSFVSLQIQSRPEAESILRERQVYDYPKVAIREFLMNAVMHRMYENSNTPIRFYWFSDRIEIQSPGGLYGEVTPENFPRQNAYRNPVIAEAMKIMGYVNKFGRGVLFAQESLAKNGNPPAKFTFESTYFLVTIQRGP